MLGTQRTSDSVADALVRALGELTSGVVLNNVTPVTRNQAMGKVPESNMISLGVGATAAAADATISLWLWCEIANRWMHGGANDNDYTKIFEQNSEGGFRARNNRLYYLTSSVDVSEAWVGDSTPQL